MRTSDRQIVRELVDAELAAHRAETDRRLLAIETELREEFTAELDAISTRVTTVHRLALRELTRQAERNRPA